MSRLTGWCSTTYLPFETPPLVAPRACAEMSPAAAIINLKSDARYVDLELANITPVGAKPDLDLPDGWHLADTKNGLRITVPETVDQGLYKLPLLLDGNRPRRCN